MNTQTQEQKPIFRDVMIPRQPIRYVDHAVLQIAAELKTARYPEADIMAAVELVVILSGWTMDQYNAEIAAMGFTQEKKTLRQN